MHVLEQFDTKTQKYIPTLHQSLDDRNPVSVDTLKASLLLHSFHGHMFTYSFPFVSSQLFFFVSRASYVVEFI